jgi:hypothetical protein
MHTFTHIQKIHFLSHIDKYTPITDAYTHTHKHTLHIDTHKLTHIHKHTHTHKFTTTHTEINAQTQFFVQKSFRPKFLKNL